MLDDIERLSHLFRGLCTIFGVLSVLAGLGLVIVGLQLGAQLNQTAAQVNTALYASSGILSNITSMANTAVSTTRLASQNITVMLNNFSRSMVTIQGSLQKEANIFHNGTSAQFFPQGSQQIGDSFQTLAVQFNAIGSYGIPPLRGLTNTTLTRTSTQLANIGQQVSRINGSLSSLAATFRANVDLAQATIPLLFLGFGLYSMLQGVIFLMLAKLSAYLVTSALSYSASAPAPKTAPPMPKNIPAATQIAQPGRTRRKRQQSQSAAEEDGTR